MNDQRQMSNRRTICSAGIAIGLVLGGTNGEALAQCEMQKILALDGERHDLFGTSVAIDGDLMVVGAIFFDGNDFSTGSAYIYRAESPNWFQDTVLFTSDGQPDDLFGNSVATDGDVVVVGAPGVDGETQDYGAIFIYRFDGSIWVETKITASDGANNDKFGRSVALSGNVVITGSDGDDDNGLGSGSAYIYRYDGRSWMEEAKILASDGAANDEFGVSVSIDGDIAVVGADGQNENGMIAGAAYVYRYDPARSRWVEEAKLLASDGQSFDFFGHSVAISGNHILVGAPQFFSGRPGAAYVYEHNGLQWNEQARVCAVDGALEDQFGRTVAIHEDTAVVGVWQDDDNGEESGSAYVYRFVSGSSTWVEQAKVLASDGSAGDQFGASVSLFRGVVAVGTVRDDDNGIDSGSAYIFSLDGRDCNLNGICDSRDIIDGGSNDANGNMVPDECDADLDGDGVVGILDFLQLLAAWGSCAACNDCPEDLDGDCTVGITDFLTLLANWTA